MSATPFANTNEFCAALGWFYAVWSSVELTIDCAIGKLESTPPEQTHATVALLTFSGKAKRLRPLLAKSNRSNVTEVTELLNGIENDFRNIFSHSFIASDADSVSFIYRKNTKPYECTGYTFTADEFLVHVKDFVRRARAFQEALGLSQKEIADFGSYALPEETSGASTPGT